MALPLELRLEEEPLSHSSLLSILTTPETPEETQAISALIEKIEAARAALSELPPEKWEPGLHAFAAARTRSSATLKRGELESWQLTNAWVEAQITSGETLTWEKVLEINRRLLRREPSEEMVRTFAIYVGPYEACPAEKLPEMLGHFRDEVLHNLQSLNPLKAAALAQYWLVSLHPFADGNGRTAVMLADWLLVQNGYLPQSFDFKIDAVIAAFDAGRVMRTPAAAILKVLKNVLRSYSLLLNQSLLDD